MKLSLPADSRLLQPDFVFGVATSSFQIEGDRNGRLESIWDRFCATPGKIRDGSNGDVACDHINRWADDVALIDSLGMDAFRLSLSWPRLMDAEGQLRPQGVAFYRQLLSALKQRGIKTFVTLYHWDLPQYLQDQGGWVNRQTAYQFRHYADLVSQALGDLVDSYATLNEPFCSAYLGYEAGIHAPGHTSQAEGRQAAHHLLLAHGLAMPVLRANAPAASHGIVLNFTPCYAASPDDEAATEWANQYFNQWYIKPLFDRCYPNCLATLPVEVQPKVQAEDFAIIAAPLDFLGVNFYTRHVYQAAPAEPYGHRLVAQVDVPHTDIGWEIYPKALTDLLVDLAARYPLPPIYITENGAAMADQLQDTQDAQDGQSSRVQDTDRLDYYQKHLLAVDAAIRQGVDVRGYFAWSLLDNFEWAEGYLKRFGIVYVDYQTQQRIVKQSGLALRDLSLSRR